MRKIPLAIATVLITFRMIALEEPYPLTENSFSNPEFVKRFVGSYGFDLTLNPQITQEESELFQRVAPMMDRNRSGAIRELQTYIQTKMASEDKNYSAAVDYTIGSLYLQNGNTNEAIRNYQTAIRKFPNFYRAYQNIGLTYVQNQRFEEGLEYLVKALEIGGGNGGLFGLIGYAYLSTDFPEVALDAYRNALMFQPESRDWQYGKLNALLRSDQSEAAIAFIDDLLKKNPRENNLWTQQANAFLQLQKYDDAIANLEILRRLGGSTSTSLVLLGDLYLNEGLAEEAVEAYKDARNIGGLAASKVVQLAEGLLIRGAVAEADGLISELDPEGDHTPKVKISILTMGAKIALASGDKERAFKTLEAVVAEDPLNGEAQLALGDYYRDSGDMERAEFAYTSASKDDEFAWKAYIALARLEVSRRNYAKAVEYLKRAQLIDDQVFIVNYIAQLERALGR